MRLSTPLHPTQNKRRILRHQNPQNLKKTKVEEEEEARDVLEEMREKEEVVVGMDRASEELERRSRYLSSLIKQQRKKEEEEEQQQQQPKQEEEEDIPEVVVVKQLKATKIDDERKDKVAKQNNKVVEKKKKQQQLNVRIRASDMPPELQKRAFRCALEALDAMPKLDSKRLALTLKKEFDSSYGPAWHCIVGTSYGSYVTHSLGGFLYFSIDKVYILLFRTAVEPLDQ